MNDATTRRRRLGHALRQARNAAGLTQQAVAERLGCRQAKINKVERTLVSISLVDLERLIQIYDLPQDEAAELIRLAKQDHIDRPLRTAVLSVYHELSDKEPNAVEIDCWHSERIPGPLQSEPYILQQHLPASSADVTEVLRHRKERAQIITGAAGPTYRAVLSESSLHRMPGGRASNVLVDQVEHLLTMIMNYQRLELQILTFDADIPYVDTDFQILRFNNEHVKDFAYIECPGGSRKFGKDTDLTKFQDHWDALSRAALSRGDSVKFLRNLVQGDQGTRID